MPFVSGTFSLNFGRLTGYRRGMGRPLRTAEGGLIRRGSPLGEEAWLDQVVRRLALETAPAPGRERRKKVPDTFVFACCDDEVGHAEAYLEQRPVPLIAD